MRQEEHLRWKTEALDAIFAALANSPALSERLAYKGARVLNLLLKTPSSSITGYR